jgi:hypothetical protein
MQCSFLRLAKDENQVVIDETSQEIHMRNLKLVLCFAFASLSSNVVLAQCIRTPAQYSVVVPFPPGAGPVLAGTSQGSFLVPDGKRLVIEFVAFSSGPASSVSLTTTLAGRTVTYGLIEGVARASAILVKVYADPNTQVIVTSLVGPSTIAADSAIAVSGYLEDVSAKCSQ